MGHKDYINRDSKEVAYSQIDLLMKEKYDISREDYKSKWKIIRSQFEGTGPGKKKEVRSTKRRYVPPLLEGVMMLKFLIIVQNATKGFDTMKM